MDNIEAGKEVDRMIAERVFGARGLEPMQIFSWIGEKTYDGYQDAMGTKVPCYSTDIKAALTVLERMYSHFHLSCRIAYISSSQIGVAFYTAAGAQDIFTEKMNVRGSWDVSDNLATAISRAAYKAYEALNREAGKAEVMPNPPKS